MGSHPEIRAFFDEPTNTVTYLVWDPDSRHGVAIDPVLDFDPASGMVDDGSVERAAAAAEQKASSSTGCSKPISMPTICRARR